MDYYAKVFSAGQKKLFPKLGFLGEGFYLAGGTALALQLGHRTSLDFDFYTSEHFNNKLLAKKINQKFSGDIIIREDQSEDTLFAEIAGVKLSAFYYPHPLIGGLRGYGGIKIASIEDIAAMKIAAIVQRGKQRDFVDIYFLIKKLGLEKIIKLAYQKYPWYKDMAGVVIKSLVYFEDAEDEDIARGIKVLDKNFSWEKAKRKIFETVKKHQLGMIKR